MSIKEKIMADWFKMYENGLDNPKMRYAIHKNKDVTAVWVWVLTQCCRKKGDSIDFDDFVLFGGSQTLNMDTGDFNACLDILQEIGYIQHESEYILVPKWGERQSEYCRKMNKKPKQSGVCTDTVHLEESRGDKKRREYTEAFETFWKIYPRKTGKGAAYDSWQKMGCENDSEKIIASIEAQSRTVFAGTEMRFIPLCQTWLNQERWGDEAVGDVLAPQKKVKSLNQITDEAIRAAEMDDLNYK